jgi:DNA polymerase
MIVGEAPGQTEDETGLPFVGRAGNLLTAMLATAGLTRDNDTYIANMLKCRPPNNRKPTLTEVAACAPLIQQQLVLVQPKVLVLLGSTAVTGLLGLKQPLGQLRGRWLTLPSHPTVKVMPQYHPSYLLRFAQQPEGTYPANPRALAQADWHTVASHLTEL